jgi:hypothetical protein
VPVLRERVSLSQFAELIGVAPHRLNGLEVDRRGAGTVTLVLEPEDPPEGMFRAQSSRSVFAPKEIQAMAQTSGGIPQLNTGGKTISGKKGKGGRRGC